jgi:hypothetical protein
MYSSKDLRNLLSRKITGHLPRTRARVVAPCCYLNLVTSPVQLGFQSSLSFHLF